MTNLNMNKQLEYSLPYLEQLSGEDLPKEFRSVFRQFHLWSKAFHTFIQALAKR